MLHVPGFIEANIHKLCVKNLTIFKFKPITSNRSQHIATRRNMVATETTATYALKCCDRLAGAQARTISSIGVVKYETILLCLEQIAPSLAAHAYTLPGFLRMWRGGSA